MNNVGRLGVRMPFYLLLLTLFLGVTIGLGGCGGGQQQEEEAKREEPVAEQPKEQPKEEAAEEAQEEKGEAEEFEMEDLIEKGKQLAQTNGCLGCHSIDGSPRTGPTWKGLFGSERELEDGSTVTADEAYLKESIVDPSAKIVKGFPPVMPPYSQLSDEDLQALIEYIKSLK